MTASQTLLKATFNQIAQDSGLSNGLNGAHSFPRGKLPYCPPQEFYQPTESLTPNSNIVSRAQSLTYSAHKDRIYPEFFSRPTRSDYKNCETEGLLPISVTKKSPSTSHGSQESFRSSKSVFDVEEDSKFEFYVEDLDSSAALQPASATTSIQNSITKSPVVQKSLEALPRPEEEAELASPSSPIASRSAIHAPDSSVLFYSNPRFGDRYACKDAGVISAVNQRNYASPNSDEKPRKPRTSPVLSIEARRCSTSDKLRKEIFQRRAILKPIRRCQSASPPDEWIEEGKEIQGILTINQRSYKDSTQFLFPPVLSESGLSISGKRKSYDDNESDESDTTNDDEEDYDVPDPDMKAIREYNLQLCRPKDTASKSSSDTNSAYRRGMNGDSSIFALPGTSSSNIGDSSGNRVGSRSSLVTNIPCNSWMMFPLRVLPGEMVPWGLLIFVPLLILVIGLIGYAVVSISSAA